MKKRQTHTEILRQVFSRGFIIHSKQEESELPYLRGGFSVGEQLQGAVNTEEKAAVDNFGTQKF